MIINHKEAQPKRRKLEYNFCHVPFKPYKLPTKYASQESIQFATQWPKRPIFADENVDEQRWSQWANHDEIWESQSHHQHIGWGPQTLCPGKLVFSLNGPSINCFQNGPYLRKMKMTKPLPETEMTHRTKKRMPKKCWMKGWTGGNWVQCSWVTAITSSEAASVCLAPVSMSVGLPSTRKRISKEILPGG